MLNEQDRIKFEKMILKNMGYKDEAEKVAGQPDVIPDFIPLEEPTLEEKQAKMDESFARIFEPAMVKPCNQIEKPSHYNFFGEDSMPLIEKILGTEGYLGFLKGNALKYRIRAGKKGKTEDDIKKAIYYEELYNDFIRENSPQIFGTVWINR